MARRKNNKTNRKTPIQQPNEKQVSRLEKFALENNVSEDELKIMLKEIRTPTKPSTSHSYHLKDHDKKSKHRYAVLGDMHIGSKYHDNEALRIFMEKAAEFEVDCILDGGDSIDGSFNMHRGMWREQSHLGFSEQLQAYEDMYPNIGVQTYRINGNHDWSFTKDDGADPGLEIEKRRSDITHLGDDQADIMFGKTNVRLLHPAGGVSYAISYRPQKIVESYGPDAKPNILHINHYHRMLQMFNRNVHVFMDGTFQSQTDYLMRKGLTGEKGSWLVEFENDEKGTVVDMNAKFIPFYR